MQYSSDSMSHRGRQGRRPGPQLAAAVVAVSILVLSLSDIRGGYVADAFVFRATDSSYLIRFGEIVSVGGARVRSSHVQSRRPVRAGRGVFYRRRHRRQVSVRNRVASSVGTRACCLPPVCVFLCLRRSSFNEHVAHVSHDRDCPHSSAVLDMSWPWW